MLYGLTIFLSAFLLFQIQPMIAKMILPWFGGSAAVWSTALMFFQVALLAGYSYSYLLTRFVSPRHRAVVHCALLLASLLALPAIPSEAWKPVESGAPAARILGLLAATIGLPYFLLSTTGPLVQAWYVAATASPMPYRLYALSNAGSLLALLTFPIAFEPTMTTRAQAYSWSVLYVLFAALCAWTALRSGSRTIPETETGESGDKPSALLVTFWVALSFVSSVLLVSVTNHITQNVAPIPFLWIAPLSIYLLTFILAFESRRAYVRPVYLMLLPVALVGMAYAVYYDNGNAAIRILIPGLAAGLFVCCMVCHGELFRLKPDPRYLTLFYLALSAGGALGGVFVAMVAPNVFSTNLELPIGIVLCGLLVLALTWEELGHVRYAATALLIVVAAYQFYEEAHDRSRYRLLVRNFYGSMHVYDEAESDSEYAKRLLAHGTITHGAQLLDTRWQHILTSYYGSNSGLGRAIRTVQKQPYVKVGVVGLGAGVTAGFCRSGDTFQFYEINPLALKIAKEQFTYLQNCRAEKKVFLGDARLVLEKQPPQKFDVLAVDAFSSDAIPMHLLTREAMELYFRHLKPKGILAVHVSNKYLDLEPVVRQSAQALDKRMLVVEDDGGDAEYLYSTTWVLLASDPLVLGESPLASVQPKPRVLHKVRIWTDDYSNLWQILR